MSVDTELDFTLSGEFYKVFLSICRYTRGALKSIVVCTI